MSDTFNYIRFYCIISEKNETLTFVFTKGTNLEKISTWMLENHSKYIDRIRYGHTGKFFHVYIKEYSFEKAYKLRLFLENELFDHQKAIRAPLKDIMASWPDANEATIIQAKQVVPPVSIPVINPQQEAWNKFVVMVKEAKGEVINAE